MKFFKYFLLSGIFFAALGFADASVKSSKSPSSVSNSNNSSAGPDITNEAEYAEFVRKREGGHASSVQSPSSSNSSKFSATKK